MSCKINSLSSPIPCKFYTNKPKLRRTNTILFSFPSSEKQQKTISTSTSETPTTEAYTVSFKTEKGCKLGISRYPDFEYDAEGGMGTGVGAKVTENNNPANNDLPVSFDLETLYIPPLTSSTTKFLGFPLPPFLKIDIVPEAFHGSINQESGKVDLEFKAKFLFSAGSLYKAPPLMVKTVLTSEETKGTMRSGRGKRLDKEGKCRLVGVATIDPIDDFFMNSFLGLPTECLAELKAPWEGIRKQWLNYVETATHSLEHPKQTLEIMIKWQPPSQGWFSINTDDKVQGQDGIVGCGGLIRDANGHVCGFAKTNKLVLDLHCGAYEGLCMAQNRGLTAVGLKMDAQTVSQSLERTQEGCSSRRVVLRSAPSLSVSLFRHSLLCYPQSACTRASTMLYSQSHYNNHNDHNDAVALFNRMLLMRPPPPTFQFNNILSSLVKMQRFPTAISLSKHLDFKGITSDLVTLNILINCFCHLGQITLSFSVLATILKRGYHPDVITLTTLIKGLCLRGEVKKALKFHDDVVALEFQLDRISYGTLINGLCKIGETKAAIQLMRNLEERSIKPDVEIQPDMYTYTILIDGLCKGGRLKIAQEVFQHLLIKGYHLDIRTYTVMISGFCKAGLFDEALALLSKMEDNGCIPNAITFDIIICALFEKDENDKAEKLLREMIARGLL
ncbi:putative pentatricopeptide repeat-containing protein, mitochondrial [Glycine soja]